MVNENIIPIENKKPFETVYELKNYEIKTSKLSLAARAKVIKKYGGNYQSPLVDKDISEIKGYEPCKHSLCGCHCPKTKCDCGNPEFSIYEESGQKAGNASASG